MSSEFTLSHNPRCSKSRAAFDLLEARGIKAEVVKYLDTPPDLATLKDIFAKLGLESVRGMMRVKDDLYKELGLDNPDLDNQAFPARTPPPDHTGHRRHRQTARKPRSPVGLKRGKAVPT